MNNIEQDALDKRMETIVALQVAAYRNFANHVSGALEARLKTTKVTIDIMDWHEIVERLSLVVGFQPQMITDEIIDVVTEAVVTDRSADRNI